MTETETKREAEKEREALTHDIDLLSAETVSLGVLLVCKQATE